MLNGIKILKHHLLLTMLSRLFGHFKGDVYTGLEAETFEQKDVEFAQQHLRILSGLYGLLSPMDLMQAYRLEMGTKIKERNGVRICMNFGMIKSLKPCKKTSKQMLQLLLLIWHRMSILKQLKRKT